MNELPWLTNIPADDINFQGALETASPETIREAIQQMEGKKGNKTRLRALRARLRLLGKIKERQDTMASE